MVVIPTTQRLENDSFYFKIFYKPLSTKMPLIKFDKRRPNDPKYVRGGPKKVSFWPPLKCTLAPLRV
jgi:hypothetical protein